MKIQGLQQGQPPFRKALSLYREGRLSELEAELSRIASQATDSDHRSAALAWQVWVLAWQCRHSEAEARLDQPPGIRKRVLVRLAAAFLLTRRQELSKAQAILTDLRKSSRLSDLETAGIESLRAYVCVESGHWRLGEESLAEADAAAENCEASPLLTFCLTALSYVKVIHSFYVGRLETALEGCETLKETLENSQDPFLGAELYNVRGTLFVDLGQYDRGEQDQLRALELQREISSREEEINSYFHLGELKWSQGLAQEAMDWFLRCEEESAASGMERSGHYWGIGVCHLQRGEYEKAREVLDEGYRVAQATGRQVWRHRIRAALAECAYRTSDVDRLTECLQDLDAVTRAAKSDEVAATTAWASFLRYTLIEDKHAAEESLEQFHELVLNIENLSLAARLALQGATFAVDLPALSHAERFADLARRTLEVLVPTPDSEHFLPQRAKLRLAAGALAHRRGDYEKAELELRAGLDEAGRGGFLTFLDARLREQLAVTLCETDRLDEAEEYLQNARFLYHTVEGYVPPSYWKALDRLASLNTEALKTKSHREHRVDTLRLFDGRILLAGSRLRDTLYIAKQYSRGTRPILLLGESGVGKEYLARYIHTVRSPNGPFVPVGSWTDRGEMFLDRLFGHVTGAYTSARKPRSGAVARAKGGTLFLDEIHNCPREHQGALLRFLREGEYSPVGSDELRQAECCVVAATNESVEALRHDFAVRLNVLTIEIPPLRDRKEEIPGLVRLFLRLHREKTGDKYTIEPSAIAALTSQPWHLNIAELENVTERAILLAQRGVIDERVIRTACGDVSPLVTSAEEGRFATLREHEATYIRLVLAEIRSVSSAARILDISRTTLYKKMKDYQIRIDDARA